ncbi:MAG: lysophospholipid acyltransferase family protein [Pseudomonadota bacterium]
MWLFLQNFRSKVIGYLGYGVSRAIGLTLRVNIVSAAPINDIKSCIFAFWHGKQYIPSLYMTRGVHKITALVSSSRDGQMMATWLECLGYDVVRGSSGRRAVAGLVLLLNAIQKGSSIALATDGPRGPAELSKKGVAYLASKTGCPIVPLGSACSSVWTLPTWDRYQLPKPFSRVVLYMGLPLYCPSAMTSEEFLVEADKAIHQANAMAQQIVLPSSSQ